MLLYKQSHAVNLHLKRIMCSNLIVYSLNLGTVIYNNLNTELIKPNILSPILFYTFH